MTREMVSTGRVKLRKLAERRPFFTVVLAGTPMREGLLDRRESTVSVVRAQLRFAVQDEVEPPTSVGAVVVTVFSVGPVTHF